MGTRTAMRIRKVKRMAAAAAVPVSLEWPLHQYSVLHVGALEWGKTNSVPRQYHSKSHEFCTFSSNSNVHRYLWIYWYTHTVYAEECMKKHIGSIQRMKIIQVIPTPLFICNALHIYAYRYMPYMCAYITSFMFITLFIYEVYYIPGT